MEELKAQIKKMIDISEAEMQELLRHSYVKKFDRKTYLSEAGSVSQEVFFIVSGWVRVMLIDQKGVEHTIHFGTENQFLSEYASFLTHEESIYYLQALEPVVAVVMPRQSVEWGYKNLAQGDKLGRLIAEYYFIYLDRRIGNIYANNPVERYKKIDSIFPDIHNRVPQHMIASYLGVTPVHLSRLKKVAFGKV